MKKGMKPSPTGAKEDGDEVQVLLTPEQENEAEARKPEVCTTSYHLKSHHVMSFMLGI